MANEFITTTTIIEDENFDIIAALAAINALVDVDGVLVDVETYVKYTAEAE